MPLADYQTLVDNLVRDDTAKIATADRDRAIDLAVKRYSKDRPRMMVSDLTAPGGNLLPLPAGFVLDESRIVDLEYPIGEVPPCHLEGWDLYQLPAETKIMVLDAPPASASLRARWTLRHTLDGATETIPVKDREPVACWAAAVLLDQLASATAGNKQSTIAADAVDHAGKSDAYAARARGLRKRYFDELGIDPKRAVAAGAIVNLDFPDSRGRDRLMHPARYA